MGEGVVLLHFKGARVRAIAKKKRNNVLKFFQKTCFFFRKFRIRGSTFIQGESIRQYETVGIEFGTGIYI